MYKPVKMQDIRRAPKQFSDLDSIFHPRWTSCADFIVLQRRGSGHAFDVIARDLGRTTRAVEQRWHKLRVVPQVERRLKAYGLSDQPYQMPGAELDASKEFARILSRVSRQSSIPEDRIIGKNLDKPAVHARQDVMRFASEAGLTQREIAEFLGRGVNAVNHGIHASRKRFEDRQAARV